MMNLLAIVAIAFQLYMLLMLWIALQTLRKRVAKPGAGTLTVSVLVPFRNEAANLTQLIATLDASNLQQFIFIDDASEDEGAALVQAVVEQDDRFMLCSAQSAGKKHALREGLKHATGEVILTLDADVHLTPGWLQRMQENLRTFPSTLWIYPVLIERPMRFHERFEALDVLSLTASTQAFAKSGNAIMASGAALAVRRDFYTKAIEQLRHEMASGDDVFLVHYATRLKKPVFVADQHDDTVFVAPQPDWKSFFMQRIRWGQKSTAYRNTLALFTAVIVLVTNVLFLAVLGILLFTGHPLALALLLGKIVADLFAVFPTALRLKQLHLLPMLVPMSVLYPLYIAVSGVGGFFVRPVWKGRKI